MHTKLSTALLAAVVLVQAAHAQQPTRLPGVVITAPVDKPGPRVLAGVVRDTFAVAIDSVEITIPSLQRRTHTDTAGKFRFEGLRPGEYQVRARRIGYGPQIRKIVVADDGGIGTFSLLPLHRALPPVIVSAERGGLSGVVGDTAYQAIPGVGVRLLGEDKYTRTDSLGRFFFTVRPGSYMVDIKEDGFQEKIVSVHVPADTGRHMSVFLTPRTGPVPVREVHNVEDFRSRIAWRNHNTSRIYDHEDLVGMGIEWIHDAVQAGYTISGGRGTIGGGCAAILNGGPATVNIDQLTIDDVESVEVYPGPVGELMPMQRRRAPNVVGKKGVADSRAASNSVFMLSNTDRAQSENAGLNTCTVVYVWSR